MVTIEERFWAKVYFPPCEDDCWTWTAAKDPKGYGRFGLGSRASGIVLTHRYSYELMVGSIPEGLVLDHLCRNPTCVNPSHLEPVTNFENLRRGNAWVFWAKKTHCPQGHPYDEQNTYLYQGRRYCKTCNRKYVLASKAKARAAASKAAASS